MLFLSQTPLVVKARLPHTFKKNNGASPPAVSLSLQPPLAVRRPRPLRPAPSVSRSPQPPLVLRRPRPLHPALATPVVRGPRRTLRTYLNWPAGELPRWTPEPIDAGAGAASRPVASFARPAWRERSAEGAAASGRAGVGGTGTPARVGYR